MTTAAASRGKLAVFALLWLGPGTALAVYLRRADMLTRTGGAQHLLLLAALALACLIPFTFAAVQRLAMGVQRLAMALVLAATQFVMLCFYAVVVLAVKSWQSMPSAEVVRTYLEQWQATLELVGIGRAAFFIFLVCLLLGLVCVHWQLSASLLTWAESVPPRRMRFSLAGLLVLYAVTQPLWRDREPVHILWSKENFSMMIPVGMLNAPPSESAAVLLPPGPEFTPRNLILISVDALRSDQMNVYGAPVDDTPFLSSLQREGKLQRIGPVYAMCTFSLCGLPGLQASATWDELNTKPLTLADALGRDGYNTYFFMSGDHTHFYGLKRFFGAHLTQYRDGSSLGSLGVNDDRNLLRWLDAVPWNAAPANFVNMHLMSVHFIGTHRPEFGRWQPSQVTLGTMLSPTQMRTVYRNHYWNGVLQADDTIRQIFALLERKGVLRNALVIITADHGEYMGERGLYNHGHEPYEPVVRIPLLIYDPLQTTPLPARALTGQIDIAPTLLWAIKAPIPASWSGVPLQVPTGRKVLAVDSYEAAGIVAQLGDGRWKYLRARKSHAEFLFDLTSAQGETRNLADDPASADVLRQMRSLFAQAHPSEL